MNGFKLCMFKHCIPLEKVSALGIHGDVSIVMCDFINVSVLHLDTFAIMLFFLSNLLDV